MGHEGLVEHGEQRDPEEAKLFAGPLDIILIYHNIGAATFHAAFYQDCPGPGVTPAFDEVDFVRLKSNMYHTEGATTLEGARQHVSELREKIEIADTNVDTDHPLPWDGIAGDVMLLPNWRRQGSERAVSAVLGRFITGA